MFFPSSANNNYNINPFSHLPSSSSYNIPPGQTVFNHESNDILFNHHHDLVPAASSMLLPATNPHHQQLNLNESTLLNMAFLNKNGDHGVGFGGGIQGPGFGFQAKKAVKKDRHSKICTAQGVRDRRVRLSIEIAREFFDLQDMLGFDKASQTVEWLLRKSKNAIKEAVKMNQHGDSCAEEDDDQYEMVDEGITSFQSNSALEQLEGVVSKDKKMKKPHKASASVPLQAKESRAKARARARERTREKMCSTGSGSSTKACPDSSPHLAYGHNNHSMTSSSSFKVVGHQVEQPSSAASRDNVIEESILIRRMLRPSTILGYQQNYLSTSKDENINGFPNLSQNWDINGAMSHSTLCAIANVNLSTGVQLYNKP